MPARIDHLVIAASSLDEGVAWCEATFGVVPGPGGVHPLMGTHNRLLKIATADFPRAYLEIIAIDPGQKPTRHAAFHRWFDLDDAELQATLARGKAFVAIFTSRLCVPISGCTPPGPGATPKVASHQATPSSRLRAAITRWSMRADMVFPRG